MRKKKIGSIISNKMHKTVVVAVTQQTTHVKYKKTLTNTKKYKAHDELNRYKIGDLVTIQETSPLSKTKRWVVINVVSN